MNKDIMKACGFETEINLVEDKKCPFCSKVINVQTEFRDMLSVKEYYISGICQTCQDKVFAPPKEDNE